MGEVNRNDQISGPEFDAEQNRQIIWQTEIPDPKPKV
jgi:hypothetical protein